MTTSTAPRTLTVALLGNPNTGKSTLFSALAGVRQRTGNFPGVTVEKKIGRAEFEGQSFELVDLPGTYSLAPRSPDEMVAVEVLLGLRSDVPSPDVVLCIVDASNLERNFYLLSQILELGLPTVLAVNMVDLAKAKGLSLDLAKLAAQLPVTIVPLEAHRKKGLSELKAALAKAATQTVTKIASPFPEKFSSEVDALAAEVSKHGGDREVPRYLVERLLLDTSGYLASSGRFQATDELAKKVTAARERLVGVGCPIPAIEAMSRYKWAGTVLQGVVTRPTTRQITLSDKIDRVLTHWFAGSLVFAIVMFLMFQVVSHVSDFPTEDFGAGAALDWVLAWLSSLVESVVPEGQLRSLLVKGVVGGVGGVVVFLPQILALFLFIAILEDCGYMARAAYLMDRLMSRVGLSGKSFIPLLSSFACAVPGIMAARVIENRRDRLTTMLVAPLMSCSARLPVYVLLTTAFIPKKTYLGGWIGLHGLVYMAMYAIGILTAVIVAFALKKTLLRGATPPFVMELPSYKLPGLRIVFERMFEQGWAFIKRAGTLILAVSIVVWALAYYPRNNDALPKDLIAEQTAITQQINALPKGNEERAELKEQLAQVDYKIEGLHLENSFLGQMGHAIEPIVRPLGWDWKLGCAAIASFPAREVIVATLGIIYNLGDEQDEESSELRSALSNATWAGTNRPVFTIPTALSVMVFFALCAQCSSTLAIMRRETASWRWPIFTFVYMTVLAYAASFVVYQVGTFLLG